MRKVTETFTCEHCNAEFPTEADHDKHVLAHDIVYIGLERNEWRTLIKSIVEASYSYHFDPKVVNKLLQHKIGVSR